MIGLYGIASHSPVDTVRVLKRVIEEDELDVSIQVLTPSDNEYDGESNAVVVIGHQLLDRNRKVLDKKKVRVYLVDNPVFCSNYTDLQFLDVEKKGTLKFILTPLTDAAVRESLRQKVKVSTEKVKVDVIPTLLGQTNSSVLLPIQTFLYTIANADERSKYHARLFSWLSDNGDVDQLTFLDESKKAHKRLLDWMRTETGKKAAKALHTCLSSRSNGKQIKFSKLEEKYGVSAFDIKYALLALRKARGYEEINKTTRELYEERNKDRVRAPEKKKKRKVKV